MGRTAVTHIYTADPSAHVFEGKLYIYPSHDLDHEQTSNDNGDQYDMEDYHVLSMDGSDGACVDHGEALHLRDIPWAKQQLWAPDAAYRDGTYYFSSLRATTIPFFRIGVATSSSPAGRSSRAKLYPGQLQHRPGRVRRKDEAYMYFGGLWADSWSTGRRARSSRMPMDPLRTRPPSVRASPGSAAIC